MIFFKNTSKKSVELVGGDMDGTITTVQKTSPELKFENPVYLSGHDLSGSVNETN